MAVIEKFLGRRVTLPDNLRYFVKQGLWARLDDRTIVFGFSEPALTLFGGIQDLNFLAEDGETVEQGQSVLFRNHRQDPLYRFPGSGRHSFQRRSQNRSGGHQPGSLRQGLALCRDHRGPCCPGLPGPFGLRCLPGKPSEQRRVQKPGRAERRSQRRMQGGLFGNPDAEDPSIRRACDGRGLC